METAFGRNFSEVRVHTGDDAAQAARGLNARAFSIGSNIAFDEGEYQPGSLIGEALLAHELAHVAQQDGATPEPMKNIPTEDSAIELDADKSAINAVLSLWSAGKTTLANISQNAMPTLRSGLGLRRCVKATKTNDAAVKLLSDSYGKYKKISGGSVEVLEQKDFEKKYDEIYGATQYSWSNYVVPKFGNLEGFAHGGINYINKDKMSIDTVPHEMLHNNADPGWKGFAGSNINEGVTEYLTIKAVTAAGQTPTHSYPNQEGVIQVLVATVGEDKIMKAYFNGEIEALKKEVDSKCKGSWDAFKAAMDKDEWLKAKGLAKSK
jgi:hypothetical protein